MEQRYQKVRDIFVAPLFFDFFEKFNFLKAEKLRIS
jgi:hypothetical protein